ncbi:hypothetical protein HAP41_0000039955 [Bradyrhizobium barranii subsp. apii]|uniref:Uncharacterized protein n=1 Tax=Bradyrhizobium barranii subsp. apii TaxID=2819348 RepID=A0A8T5V3V3_9BRAD|nr:hypothetical protein [Bradyrhizobium barranii]UPT86370.1 hypothetical protein HAP41_0000039955 [Bradyrhizobium barranii subsp. apii]UPT99044.1 hypothetical protein J4G48_0013755 [Bradyrhizobium barranii subsp. apii]
MASLALDLVLWLTGVRGHIPRFDDFRPAPAAPSVGAGYLVRVLAIHLCRAVARGLGHGLDCDPASLIDNHRFTIAHS